VATNYYESAAAKFGLGKSIVSGLPVIGQLMTWNSGA
jgi:membrane protein YqaA with SNARE-associated domain